MQPDKKLSAAEIGAAAIDAATKMANLGLLRADPDGIVRPEVILDKRDIKVPAGMKKVYTQSPPHQGKKEIVRRARQMAAKEKK